MGNHQVIPVGRNTMPDERKRTEDLVREMAESLARNSHPGGTPVKPQRLLAGFQNIHASILDSIPHAVIGLKERFIFFANDGVYSVFGWPPEQLIGKNSRVLYRTDEEYEEIAQRYYPALEASKNHSGEFPCRHRDGRDITCRVTAARVGSALRNLMIVVTYEDITGFKELEQSLRLATRYNRSLIEASPDPLFTIDNQGKIADVNASTERVTGFSRQELVGTDFSRYFTETGKALEAHRSALQKGSVRDYALEIKHRQGHTTPVLYSAAVYRSNEGAVLGVLVAARDISVRKRMEEALKDANTELERRIGDRTEELRQKTRHLEEVNTALKVLLEQRDTDKRLFEESIMENVKLLILPHIEKLKKCRLTPEQAAHVEILESAMASITSHFTMHLSSMLRGLTPTEIRIADLIKGGRTSKEIAQLLNTSENTVLFHRHNLRKKLNLKGRGSNLRSHLETVGQ